MRLPWTIGVGPMSSQRSLDEGDRRVREDDVTKDTEGAKVL